MDAPEIAPPLVSSDSSDPRRPAHRILIVDDDAGLRDAVARVLDGAGYRTACAEDGEEGWNALCSDRFDAMITDHDMPRLTGLDLIRRLRAGSRELPVILMSGRMPSDEKNLFPLLSPGAALAKPFSFAELLVKLQGVLMPPNMA